MQFDVKNRVVELFNEENFLCAETVLTVIAEAGGRDASECVAMATGFCSGMARTCGQCGAVSGAVMGIGLFTGRTQPGGDYEGTYALVQEFLDRFQKASGSINCFALIGCDFATPEGKVRFKEKKLSRKCTALCVLAVETALELLSEHGYIADR